MEAECSLEMLAHTRLHCVMNEKMSLKFLVLWKPHLICLCIPVTRIVRFIEGLY